MNTSAYVVLAAPFFLLWIVLFLKSAGIRTAILTVSALGALAGPIGEYWFLKDYWHPDYLIPLHVGKWRFGIEDYILTFAIVGIAVALFEKLAARKEWGVLPPVSWKSLIRMDMIGNFGILLMIFFASIVRMNSIYAVMLILLISSAALYWKKPAWIPGVLIIAAGFSIFYWAVFKFVFLPLFPGILERWWNLEALWGVRIAGVPIEEPLWAFCVALFVGPLYRACSGGTGIRES